MYCKKCKNIITDNDETQKNKVDNPLGISNRYFCIKCYVKFIVFVDSLKF